MRAVFPNLPPTFQSAIKGLPMRPPYFGACTAAMDGNEVITSHDLTTETRFDERFVQLCIGHGIRALQSRPVLGRDRFPIGTFVMGYSKPADVRDFDIALMEFAADAIGTVLQAHWDGAA
ncbi:MAG TPA: GAF domain-containing protein [Bradyrhizobium sp.]|uniref:GAF domain-containing protein n=1 Tax=Bradyrhizobium sp. TaxID=376 RepID=UPI002D807CFC|nr:GAF domain-containing protein [Bradyrhizobium sp.]HET7888400.1 GAF domain-containing protein [Bradyrhizobium sp.]